MATIVVSALWAACHGCDLGLGLRPLPLLPTAQAACATYAAGPGRVQRKSSTALRHWMQPGSPAGATRLRGLASVTGWPLWLTN